MTLYADHNVSGKIVGWLRNSGQDIVTARTIGLDRAKDDEQLLIAAQRRWTLVTHNEADFFLLHDAWRRWSAAWEVDVAHAGILIPVQAPRATVLQIAHALDDFIRSGVSCTNELHTWRPASGWRRRD